MSQPPTGTITFLFTDIEGSTQMWEQHPDAMRLALARHDACLRTAIETRRGHIFKRMGDAFCAAFAQAADALDAAIAAQQSLRALQPPNEAAVAELSLKVRIALHSGAAETREGDYFGPTLNRIARLLTVGYGGQVLLSRTAYDLVQNEVPTHVAFRDLGLYRLRDLQEPEQIYQLLHPELPADFPSLKTYSILPHNLPQQTTRFVGREREIARVTELLARVRLLTLTGTGGTGKTRLSLQVAAELLSGFEDGVWLVELAALADPALVPQAIAASLTLREELGKPLTETLVEYLQPRQALLIIDNCEHLLAPVPGPAPTGMPGHEAGGVSLIHVLLQRCPNIRILATSRERLNIPGEQTYRVPSLSAPNPVDLPQTLVGADLVSALNEFEAVQMFVDRAALVQPSFALTPANATSVAQLCHQLDGIPLAIELAAARLNLLSVEQIAQLDDRFRLLTGGSRVALRRQQTLRALIDWSYDLLSEAERTLLRRLSTFAGGFTLQAAEAVGAGASIEANEVLNLLGRLVEKSLVLVAEQEGVVGPGPGRYRLQETIRQYGSEKLWAAGEGTVARWLHRGWCLRFAERALSALAGPDRATWLQRLVKEYDNIRAALGPADRTHPRGGASGERGDLPLGPARLARWGQVVELLVLTYRHLSRSKAAHGVLEDFIALCQAEGNALWLARAYTLMGIFLRLHVGLEASRSMFEQAIAVCEAHGLDDWVVYPQARLAHDLAFDGVDLERAEALARACPPDADTARDVQWLVSGRRTLGATIYTTLMWAATHRADWEALKDAFEKSLAWGGPTRDPLELLMTIEETCLLHGAEATFHDLCRFMAEGYARAGLEAPLQQWYLEPASPRSLQGEPWVAERFEDEGWHPALRWHDPTGPSRIDRTTRPGWLGLYPPTGCNLWPATDLNAPRLVAAVQGNFVAQTRVELGQAAGVLAGLLVWRDERHFARLELQSRKAGWDRAEPVLQACVGGQFRPIGRGQCARQAMWLRIERVGEELRGLCSEDGEQWLACGVVRLPPGAADEVGLAAIPHGSGGYAWFDTLLIWGRAPD